MSNDFEKVPDIVWQLFLEIMWASPGPGHPCELLNERERMNARAIAWGWDPPLIEVGTLTELTPHGLAYTAWKDIQPKQKRTGRPKKDQKSSDTKIIAALCRWHGYEQGGSVEKYDPAKLKDIARLAEPSLRILWSLTVGNSRPKRTSPTPHSQTCQVVGRTMQQSR